jgi:hypothetical protein
MTTGDNRQTRYLALLAGNGAIFLTLATYTGERFAQLRASDVSAMGSLLLNPLAGVVAAYIGLLLLGPGRGKVARYAGYLMEIIASFAFVSICVAFITTLLEHPR